MPLENPNRTGNRPSSLATTRLCSLAGILSKSSGAGRAALVSSAIHALWSDSPEASSLLDLLTSEEREQAETWRKPDPLKWGGTEIRYENAMTELYVSCDEYGFGVDPDQSHLNGGTIDFCDVLHYDGKRIVLIGDLKKTRWSSSEGPNGLQLAAYGFAACAHFKADGYVPAFWYLEDAEWDIGDIVWMGSDAAKDKWRECLVALKNTDGRGTTGDHCDTCWERAHCPEYLALGIQGNDAMTKALRGDELTSEERLSALVAAEAATDAGKLVRDRLKALVREGHEITNAKGKRWLPVIMPGRRSGPSVKQLEEMGRQDLIRQGADYEQMKWINGRK